MKLGQDKGSKIIRLILCGLITGIVLALTIILSIVLVGNLFNPFIFILSLLLPVTILVLMEQLSKKFSAREDLVSAIAIVEAAIIVSGYVPSTGANMDLQASMMMVVILYIVSTVILRLIWLFISRRIERKKKNGTL